MIHELPLQALPEKQDDDNSMWVAHFGGLFNPVHDRHVAIGRSLLDNYSFDRVVYVPGSSHYAKPDLAPEAARLSLLQMALAGEPRFEASEYELGKDDWTEPLDTIMHLKDRFTEEAEAVRLFTVRGDDWLPKLLTWTDEIAEHEGLYDFIIVPRIRPSLEDIPISPEQRGLISRMCYEMEATKPVDVSSTFVRERLREGTVTDLPISDGTLDYIQRQELYGLVSSEPEATTENNQ